MAALPVCGKGARRAAHRSPIAFVSMLQVAFRTLGKTPGFPSWQHDAATTFAARRRNRLPPPPPTSPQAKRFDLFFETGSVSVVPRLPLSSRSCIAIRGKGHREEIYNHFPRDLTFNSGLSVILLLQQSCFVKRDCISFAN